MAASLIRLDSLVRTLRERCPWDREQTHTTLRRHLLEEAYETLEALDARVGAEAPETIERLDADLCEELGDLLFQVWFHARLASERGAFGVKEIAGGVRRKLAGRHPHVFGDVDAPDADAVRANWDTIKLVEKGRESVMDGIPATLPALLRSVKVLKRAATADLIDRSPGHDALDPASGAGRQSAGVVDPAAPGGDLADVESALARLAAEGTEDRLGDLLLATVEAGRRLSIDPEDALRGATRRAETSFREIEARRRRS